MTQLKQTGARECAQEVEKCGTAAGMTALRHIHLDIARRQALVVEAHVEKDRECVQSNDTAPTMTWC